MIKKRIAVVFGTFAPLHQGHIDLIQRAKRQVWSCSCHHLVMKGTVAKVGWPYKNASAISVRPSPDDELTQVYKLDETGLPRYPLGWEPCLQTALDTISIKQRQKSWSFMWEKAYKEELEVRGFEVHLEERRFGISATMIRKIKQILKYLVPRPSDASSRKKSWSWGAPATTLTKDLARFYDAPVSLEYAVNTRSRTMFGMMNSHQRLLLPPLRQYDQTSKLIDSSANRGLVIADTNSLVTKGYYDYYMEVEGQDTSMTDTFDNLFVSILSKKMGFDPLCSADRLLCNDGFETWPWLMKRSAPAFQITQTICASNT